VDKLSQELMQHKVNELESRIEQQKLVNQKQNTLNEEQRLTVMRLQARVQKFEDIII